jgi:hypothetical protein
MKQLSLKTKVKKIIVLPELYEGKTSSKLHLTAGTVGS